MQNAMNCHEKNPKSSAKSKLSGQKTQSSRLAKGIWSSRRCVGRLGLSLTRQNAGQSQYMQLVSRLFQTPSFSPTRKKNMKKTPGNPGINTWFHPVSAVQLVESSSNFCHSSCCPGSRGDGWGRGEAFLRSKRDPVLTCPH